MSRRLLMFADATSVHTQRWAREMTQRNYEVIVATRRPAPIVGIADVIPVRPGEDLAGWPKALPAVRRLARNLAPAWIHGHYLSSNGLWAAACRGIAGAPVVLTAWGSDVLVTPSQSAWRRTLLRWALKRASLVTADSEDVLAVLAAYWPKAALHEVLWGADTERFVPAPEPTATRSFDVLSLRAWEPNYNIGAVLRGFALFVAARPQAGAKLHLFGGGSDEIPLKRLAQSLRIKSRVIFHGWVDDAGMVAAMQGARVSVSVPSSDATSVSLLESMACGLPIVASDLPANRRWVRPEGGLLVPVGDFSSMAAGVADALTRLYDEPAIGATMGRHNRERVVADGSRKLQMDRMDELYQSLRRGR